MPPTTTRGSRRRTVERRSRRGQGRTGDIHPEAPCADAVAGGAADARWNPHASSRAARDQWQGGDPRMRPQARGSRNTSIPLEKSCRVGVPYEAVWYLACRHGRGKFRAGPVCVARDTLTHDEARCVRRARGTDRRRRVAKECASVRMTKRPPRECVRGGRCVLTTELLRERLLQLVHHVEEGLGQPAEFGR